MIFSKPIILAIYLLLAAVIVSGSLELDARHRADNRLTTAHLTYGRGCDGCYQSRPSIQVDVFGDGTVIFQDASDSDGKSFVTHIDTRQVKAFFRAVDSDLSLHNVPLQAGVDAPYCYVVFHEHENGCTIEVANVNGTIAFQDHPKIIQLETLVDLQRLRSFDHKYPPAGIAIYKPSSRYIIEPLIRIPSPPPPLTT